MLNANAICQIRKNEGVDVYGQVTLATPVNERCAIVRLRQKMQHTTVRADSSQSRGAGDEFTAAIKVLIPGNTIAALGDQLSVLGVLVKITSMHPRLDAISGSIDHYEVEGELWGS